MSTSRLFAIAAIAGLLASAPAEARTFIDQSGRALEGELLSVNGAMVTIKRASDGQTFTVPATTFSRADQAYIAGKGGGAPAAPATLGTPSASPSAPASPGPSNASNAPYRI